MNAGLTFLDIFRYCGDLKHSWEIYLFPTNPQLNNKLSGYINVVVTVHVENFVFVFVSKVYS